MKDSVVAALPQTRGATVPSTWIRWLLPSTAELIFLTLSLVLLFGRNDPYFLYDGDRGWHIRAGEYILETHSIPHHDIFSFSMPDAPWVAYEWGTEIIFAALDRHFGLNGIVLLAALLLAASYSLLYRLLRREGFSFTLSFLLLLGVIMGSRFHWAARPHVVSYLFIVIFIGVLDRYLQGTLPARRLWILPGLMILWVNLHPGFIAGEILVLTFFSGALLQYSCSSAGLRASLTMKVKETGSLAGATLLTSLVNPYGYGLHVYLCGYFKTVHNLNPVNELFSPIFQMSIFQPFLVAVVGLILLMRYTRYRVRLEESLTLCIWIALGLISLRNIPVMFLVCAPIYGRLLRGLHEPLREWISRAPGLQGRLQRLFQRLERAISMERHFNRHLLVSIVLLGLFWIVIHQGYGWNKQILHFQFTEEWDYPAAGMDYVRAHRPAGNVFNEWALGGYLIYNFYPTMKVFADGRLDMYGADFAHTYLNLINSPEAGRRNENWKELFRRCQIQWVMIRPNLALRLVLDRDPEWDRPFLDEHCVIYVRKKSMS
ncbi:MAG: hypothetical protein LAO31_14570 [Acidobacteriia bacterium]|nr:hypothetical protein [Terriglobia bacterium]